MSLPAKYQPSNRIAAVSDVPCAGCRRCCIGDYIRILPLEDHTQWETQPHPVFDGARALAHAPNGNCIYLGEHGCNIHGRAPNQCQAMDCRIIAAHFSYTQARKLHPGLLKVWRRGKELLRSSH